MFDFLKKIGSRKIAIKVSLDSKKCCAALGNHCCNYCVHVCPDVFRERDFSAPKVRMPRTISWTIFQKLQRIAAEGGCHRGAISIC